MESRFRGDGWAVAWGGSAALGAWLGMRGTLGLPLWVGLAVAAGALLRRHPALVGVALVLLTATLAQRSMSGLSPPTTGPVQTEITLVTDPKPTPGGGIRADARLEGRRLALRAFRAPAAALEDRLAGERIGVLGKVEPAGDFERRFPYRHQAGRLQVDTVTGWRHGHGVTRAANGLRRTLAAGAESLSERQQSLLAGLTIGDDRRQPPDLQEAFRASGLTHLLAVSGTNVTVVLVVVSPVLQRMRFASRLVTTLAVLGAFALVTRAEPSVLRATGMAAISAYGAATGRPTSSLRTLGLAAAGVVLIDPLLVSSVGFQLSVAGSAGIILGATRLARRIPGPPWLATAIAVTAAAQLAVAPILVATFGSVPLASLPANLLAAPAAGPTTVWGLLAGSVAGVVGEPVATALHLPTRLLLGWIEGVAVTVPQVPLGELRGQHLATVALGSVAVAASGRLRSTRASGGLRLAGGLMLVAIVAMAMVAGAQGGSPAAGLVEVGRGVDLWRGGGAAVVVVDGRAVADNLATQLRAEGVRRVDAVVTRTSSPRAAAAARALHERWPAAVILAPSAAADLVAPAIIPEDRSVMTVGALRIKLDTEPERLEATITVTD
jgi:ComEC/Rec2-related protein